MRKLMNAGLDIRIPLLVEVMQKRHRTTAAVELVASRQLKDKEEDLRAYFDWHKADCDKQQRQQTQSVHGATALPLLLPDDVYL